VYVLPLTSADVVYTVEAAQNPSVKSPKRADWEGVEVSAPDAQTVVFMLSHAYSPFLENTTLGILPKHLWQNVTPEEFSFHKLNTDPIGSGPYEVVRTTADSTGAPSVFYLAAFDRFTLGYPYISSIKLSFFPNSTALLKAYKAGTIEAVAGLEPSQLTQIDPDAQVLSAPLPRVFAIFFNQSQAPVFTDASVRKALNVAINKKEIIAKALGGYGKPIDGPIPPGVLNSDKLAAEEPAEDPIANAKSILEKGGWTFDESVHTWTKKTGKKTEQLTFAISTADTPELKDTAEAVASAWRALGANVTVHVFSTSDLNTSAIRPRDYDALLFGEIVGRSLDLFAFWHSSQRIDPGLNLALYANSKADTLLTEARALVDRRQREEDYVSFAKIVQGDNPAIFLYAPDFIYVLPKSVHGTMLGALTTPAERFLNVYQWYTETEQVWHLFTQDTATE
jgi:peptide/nickel transport system substrate-binding protein